MDEPLVPAYDGTGLPALLPGVARSLGLTLDLPAVDLPDATRVCVVLVDGLGDQLLTEARSSAPFLASLSDTHAPLTAGCPSTTATSLGSLGTGLPPGRHGLVGYEVLDPDRGVLLNELRWDPAVDPLAWQPQPTMFERLTEAGIAVTNVGHPHFQGSGLNEAALRGGRFLGVADLFARVKAAAELLRDPGFVYLYFGDVDSAGHLHGCRSQAWRKALRIADRALSRLARWLPAGTLLVVTADHGMVDVPHGDRVDLADRPDLTDGVSILGGEPRFAQVYCMAGAAIEVAERLTAEFGDRAWVRNREEAIADGWFGAVSPRVAPRIGDVLVAARDSFAVIDSRTAHPTALRLVGQHGSLTAAEQLVPLLVEVV